MTKNDVTGDSLTSRPSTDAYRANYDLIFKKPPAPAPTELTTTVLHEEQTSLTKTDVDPR